MNNIKRKFTYLFYLRKHYRNWLVILIKRILKINIRKVIMSDGVILSGGISSETLDLSDEVFIRRFYLPSYLTIKNGSVVVDVGANIGDFSLFAALRGASKIICVEPNEECNTYIKQNFYLNKIKCKLDIVNAAVTSKTGQGYLALGDYDGHHHMKQKNDKEGSIVKVKTITLQKLLSDIGVKHVDFLKIDCEGSEGEIIKSTPHSVWDKVRQISLEFHNNASLLNDLQIERYLKNAGFKIKTLKRDSEYGYIYAKK